MSLLTSLARFKMAYLGLTVLTLGVGAMAAHLTAPRPNVVRADELRGAVDTVIADLATGRPATLRTEGSPQLALAEAELTNRLPLPNSRATTELWTRSCEGPVCYIRQFVRSEQGEVVQGNFGLTADRKATATITTPTNILLRPGLGLRVDDREQIGVPFTSCTPAGCKASFQIADSLLEQMRGGRRLLVGWVTTDGKQMTFPINLSGFATGWQTVAN